jgi:hypothetical protein
MTDKQKMEELNRARVESEKLKLMNSPLSDQAKFSYYQRWQRVNRKTHLIEKESRMDENPLNYFMSQPVSKKERDI